MGPGQASDAVQEDDHILAILHQPLRPFKDHIRHFDMVVRRLIEGRADDDSLDGSLHIRHLFRTLIDEEDDELHFRWLVVKLLAIFFSTVVLLALAATIARCPLPRER